MMKDKMITLAGALAGTAAMLACMFVPAAVERTVTDEQTPTHTSLPACSDPGVQRQINDPERTWTVRCQGARVTLDI